jgi:hypothetical protein
VWSKYVSCKQGNNETSGGIKDGKILNQISNKSFSRTTLFHGVNQKLEPALFT